MQLEKELFVLTEQITLLSTHLNREVKVDFFLPTNVELPENMSLLLINDGQDLQRMDFEGILNGLYEQESISPVLAVGIHAGEERRMEYGTAACPDYKGRGAKAPGYSAFILKELIPYIKATYKLNTFREKAFAGFSLGALSALDIVWNNPGIFSRVAAFSGSLWWRCKDQEDPTYSDDADRILHKQVREGLYTPGLKFFFQCGAEDEKRDRNNNGIIDSIDDTIDLIKELKLKGYTPQDIFYMLLEDGRHDVETWGRSMPRFLEWAYGNNVQM